jgi:hypothetical protein
MTKNFWLPTLGIGVAFAASVMAASCGGSQESTVALRATTTTPSGSIASGTTPSVITLSNVAIPAGTAGIGATCEGSPDASCGDLTLHRVRVLVRRTILERVPAPTGSTGATGSAGVTGPTGPTGPAWQEEGECEHDQACRHDDRVEIGPYVIDLCGLALAGTTVDVLNLPAPPGDYHDIKFVVNTIYRSGSLTPALQAMKDAHASIIVEGTYGSEKTPFTFKTPIRAAQERDGTFTFGPGANPVTLKLNPAAWFAGPDGKALNPADPRNRGAILANIRCALRMFPGDRDGDEEGERAACAGPGTAPSRSHEQDRAQCGVEDEHHDWEGCHHCCGGTALACVPITPVTAPGVTGGPPL